jgi:hypothetical protein
MKSPLVQRKKGNHKQWVVAKLHSQIFIPIAYIETIDENWVWSKFENWFNFISMLEKKNNMHKLLTLN